MKIITENAIYVQKNDLSQLYKMDSAIPASVFLKTFFENGVVIIDDSNRFEFVKFNDKKDIDFFKSTDWIVDYNEVKDLSEDEIIELAHNIYDGRNQIATKFNSMSDEEKDNNLDMINKCELLDFKLASLRDVLLFKKGDLIITLPEGIEYPKGISQNKEKGMKRLIRTLFTKNK